jgi:hypothetical protein
VQKQPVAVRQLISPKGTIYRIRQTTHQDTHELEQLKRAVQPFTTHGPDDFLGTDRKAAKTSIVPSNPEAQAGIESLLGSLPSDQTMMALNIPKDPGSQRVAQERRVVTVPALIYAASKEQDNDFHLILGDANAADTGKFMNAEISGLPAGQFRQPLQVPRQAFRDFFGANLPGRFYSVFTPPIPVTVAGSLFYDVDHPPGEVGPTGLKPQTSWEIHPISTIAFEP